MKPKRILRVVLIIILPVIFILFTLLRPVHVTSPMDSGLMEEANEIVARAALLQSEDTTLIKTAYGTVDITPSNPMPMAGYSPRSAYDSIHDRIKVQLTLLRKDDLSVCLLSADLLIFPPFLRDYIETHLSKHIYTYYSATHTHSSLGGWDPSFAGNMAVGSFQKLFWEEVGDRIVDKIQELEASAIDSDISYFEIPAPIVKNRLAPGAPVDSLILGIQIVRHNTDGALLVSFSGHPTLISRKLRIISADYPGKLNLPGYSFTMFMAGMMGSHSITQIPGENFERIDSTAEFLKSKIRSTDFEEAGNALSFMTYPLPLQGAHMRLTQNIGIRNWVFDRAFGPLDAHLTFVVIGNIILISTPCDYSGEIWANGLIQVPVGRHAIITSFNGDYIGYITQDEHYYTRDHAEVRTMNWVGPGFGEYSSRVISTSLEKITR